MPNGFGRGRGFGRGWGFGFRGASPPWPYVGVGRGGLPRCGYFLGGTGAPPPSPYQSSFYGQPATPGYTPFAPQMTREDELDYLGNQAEAMKEQMAEIQRRIKELEK